MMNRANLVAKVAVRTGLSMKGAEEAVSAVFDSIQETLARGLAVRIVGFGSISVRSRGERVGRSPRTGESLIISERKVPVFKPGKILKDACNSGGA